MNIIPGCNRLFEALHKEDFELFKFILEREMKNTGKSAAEIMNDFTGPFVNRDGRVYDLLLSHGMTDDDIGQSNMISVFPYKYKYFTEKYLEYLLRSRYRTKDDYVPFFIKMVESGRADLCHIVDKIYYQKYGERINISNQDCQIRPDIVIKLFKEGFINKTGLFSIRPMKYENMDDFLFIHEKRISVLRPDSAEMYRCCCNIHEYVCDLVVNTNILESNHVQCILGYHFNYSAFETCQVIISKICPAGVPEDMIFSLLHGVAKNIDSKKLLLLIDRADKIPAGCLSFAYDTEVFLTLMNSGKVPCNFSCNEKIDNLIKNSVANDDSRVTDKLLEFVDSEKYRNRIIIVTICASLEYVSPKVFKKYSTYCRIPYHKDIFTNTMRTIDMSMPGPWIEIYKYFFDRKCINGGTDMSCVLSSIQEEHAPVVSDKVGKRRIENLTEWKRKLRRNFTDVKIDTLSE